MSFGVRAVISGIFIVLLIMVTAFIGANVHFDNNTLLLISMVGTLLAALFLYAPRSK